MQAMRGARERREGIRAQLAVIVKNVQDAGIPVNGNLCAALVPPFNHDKDAAYRAILDREYERTDSKAIDAHNVILGTANQILLQMREIVPPIYKTQPKYKMHIDIIIRPDDHAFDLIKMARNTFVDLMKGEDNKTANQNIGKLLSERDNLKMRSALEFVNEYLRINEEIKTWDSSYTVFAPDPNFIISKFGQAYPSEKEKWYQYYTMSADPHNLDLLTLATAIDQWVKPENKDKAKETGLAANLNPKRKADDVGDRDERNNKKGKGTEGKGPYPCTNQWCIKRNEHTTHHAGNCNRSATGKVLNPKREKWINERFRQQAKATKETEATKDTDDTGGDDLINE